jgi:predicted GIY-YIG superfamily endonuclease
MEKDQEEKDQEEEEKDQEEEEKDQEEEKEEKEEEKWDFYIIVHPVGATYAGVSPDPIKRLRKHNGEIAGGAKYTRSKGKGWQHVCIVRGFQTKIQALQFEWASKHVPPRNVGGLVSRLRKLYILLNKTVWTLKSPLAATVPLTIEWIMPPALIFAGENRTVPSYITDTDANC